MAELAILDGTGAGRSVSANASRSINLYPEIDTDPMGKARITLVSTPGCSLWVTVGNGPIRAERPFAGLLFVVSGNGLYSVTSSGTVTFLGTLNTSLGRVIMSDNGVQAAGIGGNQIAVVDGVSCYIYNIVTNTFSIVTSPGFSTTPNHIAYQDGYFVLIDGTMSVYSSDQYDGLSWNPLATTPVQFASDNVRAAVGMPQGLVLVKEFTTEFYYDAGIATSTGFPFTRIQGAIIPYGTLAPCTLTLAGGTVMWLAWQQTDAGGVFVGPVMLNGYTPQFIATQAITYQMSLWTDIVNSFAWSYSEGGHTFIAFTSPGDNQTLVFDLASQKWHDRSTYQDDPYRINRHVTNAYSRFNNKHVVGDYLSGNLYVMSDAANTDYGLPIVRMRETGHIFDKSNLDSYFISKLQIDMETGTGNIGPLVPASASSTLVADGVWSVTVNDPGYDYSTAPQVILIPIDGNGSGATATAQVANGQIISVTITAPGSGYTAPPQVVFAGPKVTPVIGISWSKDGGHTFGYEQVKPIGEIGQYKTRVIFHRQGKARDRVLRIRCSDASRVILMGGYAEVES